MPTDIVALAKDAVTQGGLVWTATQMVKGLIRWRASSEVPAPLIQAIATVFSLLVAAASTPRAGQPLNDWLLQVATYGIVILMPLALAGHEVAQLGNAPAPAPALPPPAPPKEPTVAAVLAPTPPAWPGPGPR